MDMSAILVILVALVVGPLLGLFAYAVVKFIALRFVESKWADLIAVLVSIGVCLLGMITFLGAGVAGYLFWKDMEGLSPKEPKS